MESEANAFSVWSRSKRVAKRKDSQSPSCKLAGTSYTWPRDKTQPLHLLPLLQRGLCHLDPDAGK